MNKSFAIILISLMVFVSGCVQSSTQNQTQQPSQPQQTPVQQQPAQQPTQPQQQPTQQPAGPSEKQFSVTIGHTFYSPNSFETNVGDRVRFLAVASKGTGVESGLNHNHGITIDEYQINAAVVSENTPIVVTFLADKPGTFTIYCRTCWDGPFGRGHPDIRATLVVK